MNKSHTGCFSLGWASLADDPMGEVAHGMPMSRGTRPTWNSPTGWAAFVGGTDNAWKPDVAARTVGI